MLVIVNGEPKTLSLPEILDEYIKFQESVIVNRCKFDLEKAERERHILEGYKIAIDNIDEVISIIKKSESIPAAKARLIERFALSDAQAQAIVDMTLGKLSGLERQKVEDRILKLDATILELKGILSDENKIKHICRFVSGLWQIHPFREGNTRTTAVFTIQYLRSIGYKVNNDMFADYSWYFRNALVRANYKNPTLDIDYDYSFLEKFFQNLLMGTHHELKNRYLIINAPDNWTVGNDTQDDIQDLQNDTQGKPAV
jgi:hypothetical protein